MAALMAVAAACGTGILGAPAPDPYPDGNRTVTGEVERVEAYANEIDVWTEDRRIVTFHYDASTVVHYQGQTYDPTALEAGDRVTARLDRRGDGDWYAGRIDVDQGRQDRTGDDRYDPDDRYPNDEPQDPDDEFATLTGEVERIDVRDREIEIDTGRERVTFSYRTDTAVYYQGERYEVANLETGDVVRTRVERDYRGDWVTDSITVERSRQERGVGDDPFEDDPYEGDDRYDDDPRDLVRYAGTVQEVDSRRGEFVLRTERYGLKTIVMPYNAPRADRDAFDRLRRGDRVEIEVDPIEDDRAELLRFGWR
ncbi:MAG TPA: DUF5666 domain-containing protein [Thermoanaerobaculia bacterium]|nr:DUF5666 domain-containing protein [Thermoanaerobaculia bacterium]